MMGSPYIILDSGQGLRTVQCFTDDDTAASLDVNQHVTLEGVCEGLMMNVIIQKCKLSNMYKTQ
jgi:hypothetical protein